jgi:hypothetical protein
MTDWWIGTIHVISNIEIWHEQLPHPFNVVMDRILLNNVPYVDEYLFAIFVLLCIITIIQTKAFTRPPPVPLKLLPKRPCLSIQFQPDDPIITSSNHQILLPMKGMNADNGTTPTTSLNTSFMNASSSNTNTNHNHNTKQYQHHSIPKNASFIQRIDGFMSKRLSFRNNSYKNSMNYSNSITSNRSSRTTRSTSNDYNIPTITTIHPNITPIAMKSRSSSMIGNVETIHHNVDDWYDDEEDEEEEEHLQDDVFRNVDECTTTQQQQQQYTVPTESDIPFVRSTNSHHPMQDLPDSFAPLLSSSYMSLLTQQLTADLIHAIQLEGEIRLRTGRHEIPLDKDTSRPQFVFDVVEQNGCRISAVAVIGSDGLSIEQDMDVHRATTSRSKPMVKHAGLVFDPPLPLLNVAPTLIHFPTLFEDRNMIPTLRSIQFVRYIVDFIVSISSFLEKCLWILESQCQIHLSKVRITPIYKGQNRNKGTVVVNHMNQQHVHQSTTTIKSPKWRLQLAFSGHVLIFRWIPIPFISIILPSFIIPQPHALLDYLISS